VSWLSVDVADSNLTRARRAADGRMGAVALSVLGWGGLLGRERDREG
jgi:hypothetical protein